MNKKFSQHKNKEYLKTQIVEQAALSAAQILYAAFVTAEMKSEITATVDLGEERYILSFKKIISE